MRYSMCSARTADALDNQLRWASNRSLTRRGERKVPMRSLSKPEPGAVATGTLFKPGTVCRDVTGPGMLLKTVPSGHLSSWFPQRHAQLEPRARTINPRKEPGSSSGLLHALANNRQPQAGPSLLGGEKRLPNSLPQIVWNSRTTILNTNDKIPALRRLSDSHLPSRRCRL